MAGAMSQTRQLLRRHTRRATRAAPTPSRRTNAPGQTATFSVSAGGSGPLAYQWFLGATPLTNDGRISGAQSSLPTITNVQLSGAGGGAFMLNSVSFNPGPGGLAPGPSRGWSGASHSCLSPSLSLYPGTPELDKEKEKENEKDETRRGAAARMDLL
jgi:hypothetical protein